jgi:hypothetical protein
LARKLAVETTFKQLQLLKMSDSLIKTDYLHPTKVAIAKSRLSSLSHCTPDEKKEVAKK